MQTNFWMKPFFRISAKQFREIYLEFHEFQTSCATLNEFAKVCKTNEIPYVLAYGYLGAVRDGGQIRDYDVDVFVPFEEGKVS